MELNLNRRSVLKSIAASSLIAVALPGPADAQVAALPSWRDDGVSRAITDFVAGVTREGASTYVPPEERIAVFDNDGTLWVEQPVYTQFLFALDMIKALAPKNPEWKDKQPFKAVLEDEKATLLAGGEKTLLEIMAATHAGMSTDEFAASVSAWLASARDSRFQRRYDELVYLPMLELLDYLRANGFKTFIVSGGGVEFIRVFAERTYGIPPEQVIGSTGVTSFGLDANGKPVLTKEPKVEFIDDGPGKPVAINRFIGRRPIFAFGNSDGDLQMLQWTTGGDGLRFGGIVHHTDAEREYAYDRSSSVGKLDKAWDAAAENGWSVVDMKQEWKRVFAFDR